MTPPSKLQHLLQDAVAHHKAGRMDRAETLYKQLMTLAPRNFQVFDLAGRLALQQAKHADAVRCFSQALQLDPRAGACAVRLSSALVALEKSEEAERMLRRFLEKNPKSAEAWNALGYVLKVQGRLVEAVDSHKRAVEEDPKFVAGWYHYGLTLGSSGKNFQGLKCHERALALDPKNAQARYGRAQTLHKIYRIEEAVADYEAFLKAEPQHHEARSYRLFALQNVADLSPERLFAEHCAYGKAVGTGPDMLPGYDLDPERRLRVAILSPDLRTHSCAYFLEPLLRALDPAQFELYLYHDHFSEDDVSERLKSYAVVWRNFIGKPNTVVERVIRADKPDILVDLTGHIGMMIRLPIFAKRLAPVQITYLGYPDTTGVPAMDFRFTDPVADPEGEADRYATEKLVRFAPTAWAYQPPAEAPEVEPPPATSGGVVTFGCFSSPTKFTDALFAAWGRLLAAVPGSRLVLKGRDFGEPEVREHLLGRLERQGVPRERLEILERTAGTREHLELYNKIDIALDTFPYTGTTTTCEALWMGRPVITVRGDRHAARVGASLLTAIGRPELIAKDYDEYVRIAMELACDRERLASVSAGLRPAMQASPLLDHAQQGVRFVAALRECWRGRVGTFSSARQKLPSSAERGVVFASS